jgi:predicted metalloprotease with PDZ domain
MEFIISKSLSQANFFDIEFSFKANTKFVEIQLPAWRPGRYELQNFSKNIQSFKVFDEDELAIPHKKLTKDKWEIEANCKNIKIKYSYYANKTDAGSSFVDENVFYINFVNCIPYVVGGINKPVSVSLNLPKNWKIASALKFKLDRNGIAKTIAKSFCELYDSPTIASYKIQSAKYLVGKTDFYIEIVGNYSPNWDKILPAFKAFTEFQIKKMGNFPEKEYHFINWILPNAFYHGVEHGSSTMITLGPDIEGDSLLHDLLGVSSHELFHAWNICKIRPAALLPYDFTKENYFETGFVVEGITTYFGDLALVQSGVISKEEYFKELSTVCMRHFVKDGKANQSLVESSIDLWVDGYESGIPHKKVSIYNKGALVALLLDLMIRNKFDHKRSLYTLMEKMWGNFGKKEIGYTINDYKTEAENIVEEPLDEYFQNYIYGTKPLEHSLNKELVKFGLELIWKNDTSILISEIENPDKTQKINLEKFLTDNNFNAF